MRAMTVPSLVWSVSLLPKNMTDEPMMHTRLTTLQTPCETGDTRASVLNANWLYLHASAMLRAGKFLAQMQPDVWERCDFRSFGVHHCLQA